MTNSDSSFPATECSATTGEASLSASKTLKSSSASLFGITRFRPAGGSVPAASDSVNVLSVRQLLGEAIENMRAESESREQHERTARAAPIKYLQSNSVFDGYELHSVFRWILPRYGLIPTREPQSRAQALVRSLFV